MQQLLKLFDVAVLAAEAQHQHAAGVGVADQVAQDLPGVGLILSGLGAAVGMGPGVYAVQRAAYKGLCQICQCLRHTVDTAHRRDDPYLVAYADTALSAKAPECGRGTASLPGGHDPAVCYGFAIERGGQIMGVYPLTAGNIRAGVSDGISVLHHRCAAGNICQRYLMSLRNIHAERHPLAAGLHGSTGDQWLQGHCHIVVRIDLQNTAHWAASF